MTAFVYILFVFFAIGIFFLFFHLMMGKAIRPAKPDAEKMTIYECGEPTVGSAWVQFDLRYYVVALLFVIFDVEVAFFFPWAVVFGNANTLARENISHEQRVNATRELVPEFLRDTSKAGAEGTVEPMDPGTAYPLALLAFVDILVFFGVLLVGFAYLWRRGDINWVRSTAAEKVGEVQEKRIAHARELASAEA